MRVRHAGEWIADSEGVVLLHEPGRYPVAYFPIDHIRAGSLVEEPRETLHRDLGQTSWFSVRVGEKIVEHAAWRHIALPGHADVLNAKVAFAWRLLDAFYEEEERVVGHAADPYHRIDIRATARHLVVKNGERIVADTKRPLVLFESGFAPRWYVPREDVVETALTANPLQTFCPYKGLARYFDAEGAPKAAWHYPEAWREVERISGHVSFEPDVVDVTLDGKTLRLEPGQTVIPHGLDRGLDPDELLDRRG
jgi:uncharacterized protein (DUF427 family)